MSKSEATLEPLVAEGLALIADIEAKAIVLEAASKELKTKQAALEAIDEKLIALGAGRYRDEKFNACLVVPGIPKTQSADRFLLPEGALATARELAGEHFKKLFDRKEIFTPRYGFDAIAEVLLGKKECRAITALCIVPGQLAGGRRSYVKWK